MSNLKQYPAGFLGDPAVKQTEIDRSGHAARIINQILSRPADNMYATIHTSSQEALDIYQAMHAADDDSKTFEFRERVLRLALTVFGTEYFSEWVSAQHKNPEFTELHHKFIDDTILFATQGKRREYTTNNWMGLLNDNSKNNKTAKYSEIQAKFFLEQKGLEDGVNNTALTIKEFIHLWIGQDGGIDDLTASLFVLFGDR